MGYTEQKMPTLEFSRTIVTINKGSVTAQEVRDDVVSVSFQLPIAMDMNDLAIVLYPIAVE